MSHSGKVLVIGLDGATLDLVGPWMKNGLLPNLSTFLNEGIVTTLESVVPPQTASGWSSIITGKNPGKHGIFGFFKRAPDDYDLIPINSSDRKSLDIWQILSRFGKKIGVINVPITYPIRKVNGFLISGPLTPYGAKDFFYPEGVIDELSQNIGAFLPPFTDTFGRNEDEFLDKLYMTTDNLAEAIKYLMKNKEWDFFMTVFFGTDRVQHEFWKYMDPSSTDVDPVRKTKYQGAILRYYQKVDSIIGEMLAATPDDATVLVVSDHGAEQLTKYVHPNVFLLREGFLRIRRGLVEQLRYFLFKMGLTPSNFLKLGLGLRARRIKKTLGKAKTRKLMSKFFTSLKDVDWSKSKAYSFGGWGRIFINLAGREPQGIVRQGEEYEALRSQIVQRLQVLVDPDTGEKLFTSGGRIFRKEDIYIGPHIAEAPDIVFQLRRGYLSFPAYEFGSSSIISKATGWSGAHAMNGLLMLKGKNIRKGSQVDNAKIIDIAPTLLAIMGLDVPSDMDGRVLTEALTAEFLDSRQISRSDYPTQLEAEHTYTDEQVEELKRTLKGLGYL